LPLNVVMKEFDMGVELTPLCLPGITVDIK
jgi:hypothetical protein